MEIIELANFLALNASAEKPMTAEEIIRQLPGSSEEFISGCTDKKLIYGAVIRKTDSGYYVEMPICETDIALLRSMLMSMKFCEWRRQTRLCDAVNGFLPEYMRCDPKALLPAYEKYNGTFFDSFETILRALFPSDGIYYSMLTFTYCSYDGNGLLSEDGEKMTVNPISVAYTDGAFILITFYNDDKACRTVHETYRIDRMRNVEISKQPSQNYSAYTNGLLKSMRDQEEKRRAQEKAEGHMFTDRKADSAEQSITRHMNKNGFDLAWFIGTGGLTHSDENAVDVEISVRADSMDLIADNFFNCCEELERDSDNVKVRVKVAGNRRGKLVEFALRYADKVTVLSPDPVLSEIAESVDRLSSVYGKGGRK